MADLSIISELSNPTPSKIVLLVMDGLGGFGSGPGGLTELETARTPNLDKLAAMGQVGFHHPLGPGLTSGSGPAHMSLFGYEPLKNPIGRGVLEALGIDFPLRNEDIAIRGNFCTVDDAGLVTDRRAGRIPTETCVRLVEKLRDIKIDGVEIFVEPVQDYRFVIVFRADNLSGQVNETDPQHTGRPPHRVEAEVPEAERTARILNEFVDKGRDILKDEHPANMFLLRGIAKRPVLPMFPEWTKMRAAAIAVYPMYRGLARLVGMDVLQTGTTVAEEFSTLAERWDQFDFFFLHVKKTDSAGEDGDFNKKVSVIEETDAAAAVLFDLKPDVVIVTGDHSTPAALRSHSWHPVPTLISGPWVMKDGVDEFGERACMRGGLGTVYGYDLLPLGLASALKLDKYGA